MRSVLTARSSVPFQVLSTAVSTDTRSAAPVRPRASCSTETPSWASGASGKRSNAKRPSTTWRTRQRPVAGSMS